MSEYVVFKMNPRSPLPAGAIGPVATQEDAMALATEIEAKEIGSSVRVLPLEAPPNDGGTP